MSPSDCGKCTQGQFLCPSDRKTCVSNATEYVNCPGIKGTHFDWTLSVDARLDYLAAHTSLSDQISQLTNDAPELADQGIPHYNWLNDDEHGVDQVHATMFPNGCNLGASFDKKLLYDVGKAIGWEARGLHNGFVHEGNRGQNNENGVGITLYAPNMNLVRDPRWGRAQEVYSEDPRLSAALTYAFVTGGQIKDSNDYMLAAACCKHYAAYDIESKPEQRYVFSANLTVRNFWETYLPVFKACVVEAQGAHVMCSYNAIDGVPTCANEPLLNGILRRRWKWEGFVVSDYDAWAQIYQTHKYCDDMECAAAAGLNAGMDQEGGGTIAIESLQKAIDDGKTTAANVEQAFRRLFRVRIQLGMLDPPTFNSFNYVSNSTKDVEGPAHQLLALQAARQGISLYKNNGKVLPLNLDSIKRISVIGPQGPQTTLLLGNYARTPDFGISSLLSGIATAMGANMTMNCTYENDVDYDQPGGEGGDSGSQYDCCQQCQSDPNCNYFTWYENVCYLKATNAGRRARSHRISGTCTKQAWPQQLVYAQGCPSIICPDQSMFAQAVEVAASADVVVITFGLDQDIESEGHDRDIIELPPNQYALMTAVRKATKAPIIAVFIHGGTFALQNIADDADAILDAWYPGQQGGNAIADVLFGKYSPAGRAAVTYYEKTSDLPPMGNMDEYPSATSKGITYRFFQGTPAIPFGFGLSYTTFDYSNLVINNTSPSACDPVTVTVTVRNTGSVTSDEVVQFYIKTPKAQTPSPAVRLVDFERLYALAPGEFRQVTLTMTPDYHSVVYDGDDLFNPKIVVEAGEVDLYVGNGQPDYATALVKGQITVSNTQDISTC